MADEELDEGSPDESSPDDGGSGSDSLAERGKQALGDAAKRRASQSLGKAAAKEGAKLAVKGAAGPVGWALLGLDLLKDPKVRWLIIGILGLLLGLILLVAVILIGLYSPHGAGIFGTSLTNPHSILSAADMTQLRITACLDEDKDKAGTISRNCKIEQEKQAKANLKRLAQLKKLFAKAKEEAVKTKGTEAVTRSEAINTELLTATSIERIQVLRSELADHATTLTELFKELGFILPVPVIDQPQPSYCGYTSVAMVASYFKELTGHGSEPVGVVRGGLAGLLNGHLREYYPAGNVQYVDFRGGPSDPDYFANILSSLSKGAPVVLFTSFYQGPNNPWGHIMVVVGYDPEADLFIVHNPLPGGSEGNATAIQGETLTQQGLANRSGYGGGAGYLYYNGDAAALQPVAEAEGGDDA